MPMHRIDIMQGKHIDKAFHGVDGKEMASDIEHHAAVSETRMVVNCGCRQFYRYPVANG